LGFKPRVGHVVLTDKEVEVLQGKRFMIKEQVVNAKDLEILASGVGGLEKIAKLDWNNSPDKIKSEINVLVGAKDIANDLKEISGEYWKQKLALEGNDQSTGMSFYMANPKALEIASEEKGHPVAYQYARGHIVGEPKINAEKEVVNVRIQPESLKGEKVSEVNATFWGKKAEAFEKLKLTEGSTIQVSGEPSFKDYKDDDKISHRSNTITVNNFSEVKEDTKLYKQQDNVIKVKLYVAKDPEIIKTDNGEMLKLHVANEINYKSGEDWKSKKQYFDVIVFDENIRKKLGEDLKKGSKIDLDGRVVKRSYKSEKASYELKTDKYVRTVSVVADDIKLSVEKKKELKEEKAASKSSGMSR
jgi:single-stranded DNA-binding protein